MPGQGGAPVNSGWIPPCMQVSEAPPRPGLARAPRDLGVGQQVGRAPQLLRDAPLAEGAEAAGVGAAVGVVDVPGAGTGCQLVTGGRRQQL